MEQRNGQASAQDAENAEDPKNNAEAAGATDVAAIAADPAAVAGVLGCSAADGSVGAAASPTSANKIRVPGVGTLFNPGSQASSRGSAKQSPPQLDTARCGDNRRLC